MKEVQPSIIAALFETESSDEEGQTSLEATDDVFVALEGADIDMEERRIIWPDGDRLTIDQNQDSPLIERNPRLLTGLDVWEHAYYLKYQSRRADYVDAWWNVLSWEEVAKRYEMFLGGRSASSAAHPKRRRAA